MPFPFPLPPVTRGAAAVDAALRRAGCESALAAAAALQELLGVAVAVDGAPLASAPAPVAGMAEVSIALEAASCAVALEVDARLLARVLERLGGEAPRTPAACAPTDGEQTLLALAALAVIDALYDGAVRALVPRLAAGARGAVAPDALLVALELTVGDERGRGRLRVPPRALAALSALCGTAEPTAWAAALPVELALRCGTASLARDDLALLAAGDVLLLDEGAPREELLVPGGLGLRGHLEGALFHVQEIAMTETQASYPLTLAVEVARVSVTLGELARLEPGAVLALDARRDGAVVLRAGERALARGELVDVDGALGVRVLAVEGRP